MMEDLMLRLLVVSVLILVSTTVQAAEKPQAVVVRELTGNSGVTEKITGQIESAGYSVQTVEAGTLDKALSQQVGLLVLVDAAHLPAADGKPIQQYLDAGGKIIALRAPLWQTSLVKLGDKWVTADEYQRETATVLPDNILFNFSAGSTKEWKRVSNDMTSTAIIEDGVPGPAKGSTALHMKILNLTGWDNVGAYNLENPFPKGHTLTVFSAKGGPNTTQIAIEWAEKDGSRWIATIPVDKSWRRYVLKPEDFKFWSSNPQRGFRGDKLNPANAASLAFGLAFSHTGMFGGDKEFWVGPLGTAGAGSTGATVASSPDAKPMDLLYPGYKFFESTGVGKVKSTDGKDLPASSQILSAQPRPEGRGFGKGRDWRFISLATAYTVDGDWRGIPAAMMVHTPDSQYKGGIWAAFGFQDENAYKDTALLSLIGKTAERIRRGAFFLEAGTDFYTYFDDQEVKVGAVVMSLVGTGTSHYAVKQELVPIGNDKPVHIFDTTFNIYPMTLQTLDSKPVLGSPVKSWPANGLRVVSKLLQDGEVIDEISQEAYVWKPKAKKQFVTTGDGQFLLNGKPWKAHGVNYMPSSGIGTEDGEYFEHWIGVRAYDPEIIERDLEHIKGMEMNSISVFVYNGHHLAGNVLDLLRRCDNLGIKVNLSLRPGTPMDFLWDQIQPMIQYYRLWDNDTVYAYDLAWEPMFPNHEGRKRWDAEWERWIKERYKSIENAEADWGYAVPRENGKITNPPDSQIVADGEWRRMIAAYRRFLDDTLYLNYNRARMLVKSVDPNHLVSFRMAEAGNPTYNWDQALPYDFAQLAAAVDFLEPEAYGRISRDWDRVKPGWFEREYARWAAPDKPMMWAEAGVSAWDNSWMRDTEEKLDFQGAYFEQFYKMAIGSRANGIAWWWYPGGFRVGENSDFGIINPDGSDRPATKVIRENARKFLEATDQPKIDTWITFDRDTDPRGIYGIYERAEKEFWKLIDEGKKPGLKTTGTGTTSANCPLVNLGNTRYDGKGPLKYLNSAFDVLQIQSADGNWVDVKDGSEVIVDKSKPVIARAVVRNLGEAKWTSGENSGYVEFVCRIGFGIERTQIPQDIPKHQTVKLDKAQIAGKGLHAATTVRIHMRANNRGDFGELVKVRLIPR